MKKELFFKENDDILKRLSIAYDSLSKHHKIIADFIMENLDKAAYMTINVLSQYTQTSVATVLRLTYLLGYEGYPEFRQALKNQTKNELTTLQRIHMSGFAEYSIENIKQILKFDIENIKSTYEEIDETVFSNVVDKLISAERIYLIGSRTTSVLADYLGYYLNLILDGKVHTVQDNIREPFEQLMNIGKNDVALGLSFPRYSSRTIKYLSYCKKKETTVVGITDIISSPIYPLCDYVLFAKSNIISFVDTLVAPLSLINALVIGISLKNAAHTQEVFENLENLWNEHVTYDKYKNQE